MGFSGKMAPREITFVKCELVIIVETIKISCRMSLCFSLIFITIHKMMVKPSINIVDSEMD